MSLISHFGDIYQVSYVARDLEKAMDFLRKKMGAEEFALREPELTVNVGGEPRPQKIRVAMANIGKMQLEVIEPVSGAVGIYTDGVDYDRSVLTFHHVGVVVPGPIANWTKMQEEVRAGGDDFALSYAYDHGPEAMVRFAYVDTRPYYGHYTEYLWWAQGMAVANAALPDLGS
jgi:hypothetical protein